MFSYVVIILLNSEKAMYQIAVKLKGWPSFEIGIVVDLADVYIWASCYYLPNVAFGHYHYHPQRSPFIQRLGICPRLLVPSIMLFYRIPYVF